MPKHPHALQLQPPAASDEIRDASLQRVCKITGFGKLSQANDEAFARTVAEGRRGSETVARQLVTSSAAERPRRRSGTWACAGGPAVRNGLRLL